MKRVVFLVLSLCLFVFVLAACGPKEKPSEPTAPEKGEEQTTPETPIEPTPAPSEDKRAYTLSDDGKTIYFGSYPQSQVTESILISELDAESETKEWKFYSYYISGEVSEFMRYIDVEYNSIRYRGVRLTSYRPYYTTIDSSKQHSYQDENGYFTDVTYWFEYETLSWRVLEKSNGFALIVSEKVLDSHEFYPASKGENGHKANDYQTSSIRKFLNNDFYMAAFSAAERTNIFADGDDFVFPLDYEEVTKTDYGFSSDNDRKLDATDYAKAQGLNTDGGARWWLSSSNDTYDFYARYVDGYGYPEYNQYVYWCSIGVVPALKIKLFDDEETIPPEDNEPNILIAYFSCTNTTEGIANYIEAVTDGTLYEIVPQVPYTEADLAYYTGGRADKEQNDPTVRPAISGKVENMEEYDVIFLGYPIWHGGAPKIIYTFLESYDFSGKTIIPFCTSHSSGIGSSATNLHSLAASATWLDGRRFSSETSQSTVAKWINSLWHTEPNDRADKEKEMVDTIYLTIGTHKITVKLEENAATNALVELLKEGDFSYTASDYGGFEKVGDLGHTLPREDRQMTTEAGDVILYSGNQIVLFYGSNSWSYTKLGKMQGSMSEIKKILTERNPVTVTIGLQ